VKKTVPLLLALVLAGCETIPYRSDVQPDARPLVVVIGRVIRVEPLPLPPVPPESCNSETCEIVIRMHSPELVHVAVREIVFGDLREREVTFIYWSHLGFHGGSTDSLLTLQPVDGERWDWKLLSDGWDPLLVTRDGQLAVPVWSGDEWSSLPCVARSRVVPVEFVDKERYGRPLPRWGILLADVRVGLRRLDPTQREMGCRPGE
jgi:hypothetical protein